MPDQNDADQNDADRSVTAPVMTDPAVREFVLALADDKHMMGQQHAEWIGIAPFLEEDLAFCSIGQDELGHAALLYAMLDGDSDEAIDDIAFGRTADEYRSAWICEQATPDWAAAFVRHWMFDHADALRWELIADSSLEPLRDIAELVEREERYHRRHADALLDVLLADPVASRRLHAAVCEIAPSMLGLFEPVAGEASALEQGIASASFAGCEATFRAMVDERFSEVDWQPRPPQQARRTRSDEWQPLMDRMREVFALDANAVW